MSGTRVFIKKAPSEDACDFRECMSGVSSFQAPTPVHAELDESIIKGVVGIVSFPPSSTRRKRQTIFFHLKNPLTIAVGNGDGKSVNKALNKANNVCVDV